MQVGSVFSRAWSERLPERLEDKTEKAREVLSERRDAVALEQLDREYYRAKQGAFAFSDNTSNVVALAALGVGGWVGSQWGIMGAVAGALAGPLVAGVAAVVATKAVAEMNFNSKLNRWLETEGEPAAVTADRQEWKPPAKPEFASPTEAEVNQALRSWGDETLKSAARDAMTQVVTRGDLGIYKRLQSAARSRILQSRGLGHTLEAKTLWKHSDHWTTACDAVFDPNNGRLLTGIGHREKWYMTSFDEHGRVVWAATDETARSSAAVDSKGNAYFRTHNRLRCMSPEGRQLWSFDTGSSWSDSAPAVSADGTAFVLARNPEALGVQDLNQRLYAVRDGVEVWHFDLEGDYTGKPQVLLDSRGRLQVTAEDKNGPCLLTLDPKSGRRLGRVEMDSWPSYVGSAISEGPDGTLYACHGQRSLSAVSADGKKLWTYRLQNFNPQGRAPRFIQAPEADAQGNVYLATDSPGQLLKLNSSGEECWSRSLPEGFGSRPRLGPDGLLYVSSGKGELLIANSDGSLIENHQVGAQSWNNFCFGPTGEVYLNSAEGLVAFHRDPKQVSDYRPPTASAAADAGLEVNFDDDLIAIGDFQLPRA